MKDKYELNEELNELLSMMDADEYPDAVDYLERLVDEDDRGSYAPLEIAETLMHIRKLPPVLWAFVFDLLEKEGESGSKDSADALNDLGALYYDGTGCEQSFAKSVTYYERAAAAGSRQAQENLGYCYYYGRNMPVDYEKAFHYFALGAFDGHLISLYKIGDMYANGYYVPKNEKEAFLIYERCINEMTDEAAKYVAGPVFLRLGKCFLHGVGTEPNYKSALVCYQKAESFLYDMVKGGDVMYKKSMEAAVEGAAKARAKLAAELPGNEWTFDN